MSHKRFVVGGFVRDYLMGLEPKDKDYVIPYLTETEYESLFPNHKKIGNSFPVYIDDDGNENALARKESLKDNGSTYQDFDIVVGGVSLEEDLGRRDFTINSVAMDEETNEIIDPFNGVDDIKNGILRSINENAFKDDPLRILRGFRFVVRYSLSIDSKTMENMKKNAYRLADITRERIELEINKMYEQTIERPSNFFRLIDEIGGLKYIGFEEFEIAKNVLAGKPEHHPEGSVFNHLMNSLDYAKEHNFPYHMAISIMLHDLGKIVSLEPPSHIGHETKIEILENFLSKHRFSNDIIELSKIIFRKHMYIHNFEKIVKPIKLIRFYKGITKYRRDEFFTAINGDSELNDNQNKIISNLKRTFSETKIQIPIEIQKRGKDAIVNFVEQRYVEKYIEITKE